MGLSWASKIIAYNNGSFSTFNEAFWPILKNKKQFGGWWPETEPKVFFKPFIAPKEFITASYNPIYRIPLYEAALHDSVISTDRWELNELKIPALIPTKALLENLYNIPPIWVLDIQTLNKHQQYFIAYYKFFSPLHRLAATLPLTNFKWLTTDHRVQQTEFGNQLILTANFSDKIYLGIKPHCIHAIITKSQNRSEFCPAQYSHPKIVP